MMQAQKNVLKIQLEAAARGIESPSPVQKTKDANLGEGEVFFEESRAEKEARRNTYVLEFAENTRQSLNQSQTSEVIKGKRMSAAKGQMAGLNYGDMTTIDSDATLSTAAKTNFPGSAVDTAVKSQVTKQVSFTSDFKGFSQAAVQSKSIVQKAAQSGLRTAKVRKSLSTITPIEEESQKVRALTANTLKPAPKGRQKKASSVQKLRPTGWAERNAKID